MNDSSSVRGLPDRPVAPARQTSQWFETLAEASTRMGTTLDLRRTAMELVQVLVPGPADSAGVHLLTDILEPGTARPPGRTTVQRLMVHYLDPSAPADALAPGMTFPIPPGSVYEQVLTEARPMDLRRADFSRLLADPLSEPLRSYLRARAGSARMIPLTARGTALGLVVVTRSRAREPIDDQDRALIDELVSRGALHIDNARLYAEQRRVTEELTKVNAELRQAHARTREVAVTFQQSMLYSPDLPHHQDIAVRYLPAVQSLNVCGDWYDVADRADGDFSVTVDTGLGRLTDVLTAHSRLAPGPLADTVLGDLGLTAGGRDDTALVLVRL
ncbi:hypothetical protein ABZV29_13680 [Streptomyces sp. NPDC005236]|uniref:hypothetical protein n=1 Tax=Streptomyces sp. NPDC005236 TaxID=3157028 RepID=UPI0033AD9D0B